MRRGTLPLLLFIILLALGASFVVFWPHSDAGKTWHGVNNPFSVTLGLDLQGGTRVLLVPDPKFAIPSDSEMDTTRTLIEQRINSGLGVKEPSVRLQHSNGQPSIVVELPNFNGDQQAAINTLLNRGVLEFWNTGTQSLAEGATLDPTQFTQYNNGNNPPFTGADLDPSGINVGADSSTGAPLINFAVKSDKATAFGQFTSTNVNNYLTVTLDRKVLTSPRINQAITNQGQITGNFTQDSAQQIVDILKYGALPTHLDKASEELIGGTLGQESINKSLLAGILGLSIVMLFMLLYYRLPGFLADVALIVYSLVTFAVFKLIGVTMTLAGIAGFILSIGMAVDANVLIFERVKEELRAGRLMASAIDVGWRRAWPSIRDSNFSTMITCAVLYTFGQDFGATIISGFATTLFLGVVISMFTAIVVTRTFLNLLVPTGFINHPALFGLPKHAIPAPTPALARRNSTV